MPKFYVKWQIDSAKVPIDAEQRVKLWMSMLEMVKADLKSGIKKDWYFSAGGTCGYSLYEARNETDVFVSLTKYMPYIQFEVVPVLTVDQTMEALMEAVAAAKK